jgi:hypothetical protein
LTFLDRKALLISAFLISMKMPCYQISEQLYFNTSAFKQITTLFLTFAP